MIKRENLLALTLSGKQRVLKALIENPGGLTAEEIAKQAGVEVESVKVTIFHVRNVLPAGWTIPENPTGRRPKVYKLEAIE